MRASNTCTRSFWICRLLGVHAPPLKKSDVAVKANRVDRNLEKSFLLKSLNFTVIECLFWAATFFLTSWKPWIRSENCLLISKPRLLSTHWIPWRLFYSVRFCQTLFNQTEALLHTKTEWTHSLKYWANTQSSSKTVPLCFWFLEMAILGSLFFCQCSSNLANEGNSSNLYQSSSTSNFQNRVDFKSLSLGISFKKYSLFEMM